MALALSRTASIQTRAASFVPQKLLTPTVRRPSATAPTHDPSIRTRSGAVPELIGGGGLYAPVAGRLLVALPVDRMAPGVAFGGVAVAVWLTFRTL